MSTDCLFCKIINKEIPADIIYEDDDLLAFNDIAPQAPVHFLVIPKKHLYGPADIKEQEQYLAGKILRIGSELAAKHGIGDNFRVIFNNGPEAGQTVFHIHMHILGGRSLNWPPG